MKEQHKELIDFVISEFKKDNNGRLLKTDFAKLIEDKHTFDLIAKFIIDELFLVEVENAKFLILTIEGWNFTSYKDIEAKELALKAKEEAELESIIISTKINKWLLKTKWYPLVISIIAVLVSIYFGYKDTSKNNELEQRLINLEQKSKLLKDDAKHLKDPKEAVEKVATKKIDILKKTLP